MSADARPGPMTRCGPLIVDNASVARPLKVQIFDYIRATGPVSRARAAKALGISPGTVSTMTAELIEAGVLREAPVARDPGDVVRGRPPVGLAVRPEAFCVAGIKLSDRERTGILVDFAGGQLAAVRHAVTPGSMNPDTQIAAIDEMLDTMVRDAGLDRADVAALGLGIPGFVDHARGRVAWSPVLAGRDVDMAPRASERLGLPVTIDNDANLVALAELWFGKGRDKQDFAVITIEHGLGMGVVLNHGLFRGSKGLGLELGHTKVHLGGALCRCGQRGCLEAYVADYALAREATAALNVGTERLPEIPDVIESLHRAAKDGSEAAASVFRQAGRYLAAGLANVVNLFDPTLIIISGDRMRYDWLQPEDLRAEMRAYAIDEGQTMPPLELHEWGDLLWAHGAAALALSLVTQTELGAAQEAVA
ncbi:ROK family transcriptional regulator [Salipiger mucosus]|uniref:Xylose-responsive transcription regulator, ROK family n=1 Tax=Salipiger mucosus DSM 16094 TaxID=1123237 RepID=S9QJ90_9RHOB|nr:ROK family transcriptional regulator [Salipiger mucosus]EPX79613.1 Xylose-responsive transcription regulator, ROK family [Salipiger mucosus DSM 16094]